jgi:hypothetical protein
MTLSHQSKLNLSLYFALLGVGIVFFKLTHDPDPIRHALEVATFFLIGRLSAQ